MIFLTILFVVMIGAYVAVAAAFDLREHRIPNFITVPAAIAGVAFHAFSPSGWGVLTSLGGFALGFGLLLLPWMLGGGGMGDVKLFAALGAWLGPAMVMVTFATSIITAGVIAMISLTLQSCKKGMWSTKQKYLGLGEKIGGQRRGVSRILPFAIPVAVSTWGVLVYLVCQGAV